jgi:hypothetical protein
MHLSTGGSEVNRLTEVCSLLCETVGSFNHAGGHLFSTSVPGPDKVQVGVLPNLGQLPRRIDGAAEVEAAVDQDPGDSGKAVGISQELAIRQPG